MLTTIDDDLSLSRVLSCPIRGHRIDARAVSVHVTGANSVAELVRIMSPLTEGGRVVTFWGSGLGDFKLHDFVGGDDDDDDINMNLLRSKKLEPGQWDIVAYTFRAVETLSAADLRVEILRALTLVNANGIVVMCPPTEATANVSVIRSKVFPHAPPSSDVRGATNAEACARAIENVGITHYESAITISSAVNVGAFLREERLGAEKISEWLRVPLDVVKRAGSAERAALKKFCDRDGETIIQNRTLFAFFGCAGFERDARAQPSYSSWWSLEDTFVNHGLELWSEERAKLPPPDARAVVPVAAPLTPREANDLIETLANTTDLVELPRAIPLTALFDILVDVWDSLDDAT